MYLFEYIKDYEHPKVMSTFKSDVGPEAVKTGNAGQPKKAGRQATG